MELKDRIAIVTGASKGIGNAITCALLSRGAYVAAISKTPEDLQHVVDTLQKDYPDRIFAFPADVRHEQEIIKTVDAVVDMWDRVDILANCAGVSLRGSCPMAELESSELDRMMDSNFKSVAYLCREALKIMRQKDFGYIINILSSAAYRTGGGGGLYAASKYAARAITESLIHECKGTGIRVSSISPGPVNTNIWSHKEKVIPEEQKAKMLKASDIADIVLFLLQLDPNIHIDNINVEPWYYVKMR